MPDRTDATSSPVRVVCFDWGGVILRICNSWDEGCERAGVEIPPTGTVDRDALRDCAMAYEIGRLGDDEYLQRMSEATGGLHTPEEIRRVHEAWLIEEYRGMPALIDRLNETQGISTGLLSNTNGLHWREQLTPAEGGTGRFPAARRLEVRVGSHLVGLAKQNSEIYEAFEAASGARGREILYFDDLEANVTAARERGWLAARVDPQGSPADQITAFLEAHRVWS